MPQSIVARPARLLTLAALVGTSACGDAAPASGPGVAARLRVAAAAPLAPRGPDFTFAAARVTAVPSPGTGDEVANRVVQLGASAAAEVELVVPLAEPTGRFVVRVAATDAASPNDTIFRGVDTVTVTRDEDGSGDGGGGEPVEVALSYAGPDVAVASIDILPQDTVLTPGDSVLLQVAAKRADGTTVSGARTRLSVDDPAATLTTNGYVKLGDAAPAEGVVVYAGTANGVVGTVRVFARRAASEFDAVAGGLRHTCALTPQGDAYCWGANGEGQLGDGSFTDRATPTPVVAPAGVRFSTITAGAEHSCALTNTGIAYCWGSNAFGKLGDGTSTARNTPTLVSTTLRFSWLDAGDQHTCAIRMDASGEPGAIYCWGNNGSGRLGDGTQENRALPTLAAAEQAFSTVDAGGSHTCALTPEGAPYCWGYNGDGQVGDGTYGNQQGGVADRLVPTPVATQFAFREVHTGGYHSCGLTTAGAAYCWGDNNVWQVGNGAPPQDVTVPTAVLDASTFTTMEVGGGHSCGREVDGSLWCWGINADGQLGDGTTNWRSSPVRVAGSGTTPLRFTTFAGGDGHSCAIVGAANGGGGPLYCWGRNSTRQLGDGTTTRRLTPTAVVP